jgi:predicted chitinase
LYGIYSTPEQAQKAVDEIKQWATQIKKHDAEYGVTNGIWDIAKIEVSKSGGGSPATKDGLAKDIVSDESVPKSKSAAGAPRLVFDPTKSKALAPNLTSLPSTARPPSTSQLRSIMPQLSAARAANLLTPLISAMERFNINNPSRQAAFLAQLALESGQLRFMEEKPSKYSGKNFERYDGRNGNTRPGDGATYKGRGPIQLTGRDNYQRAGDALGLDLVNHPERVSDPEVGLLVAAWYWQTHGLNERADKIVTDNDFNKISNIINRGTPNRPALHQKERLQFYQRAVQSLELFAPSTPLP